MRSPALRVHLEPDELVVDNFAGGGGASVGIEWALGRSPDIAVNHDPEAIAVHAANHPATRHYCEDVWEVDPVEACAGRPVGLAWFSPNCTHFSKVKGGKPVDRKIRGLAWVVTRWAAAVRPRVIVLENVEEFADWGPVLDDGRPCPLRRGFTFRRWVARLENCGYRVETRELRGCDFGAPTTRKRLFVIARSDGRPIVWPAPTHGPGRAAAHRTAAECIDWSLPCPSIFARERPLAEATLRRIARGVRRFVVEAADPFVVPVAGRSAGVTLVQTSYGERPGQVPRVPGIDKPLGTVVAGGQKHALVAAFLAKHYGGHEGPGVPLDAPMSTITTQDHHALVTSHLAPQPAGRAGEVRAFLVKYFGTATAASLREPLHTITTRDRFGLVTVRGEQYVITDIGMRLLEPHELARAQGFPDGYKLRVLRSGRPLSKAAQVRMVGNSVCPPLAEAVLRANMLVESSLAEAV